MADDEPEVNEEEGGLSPQLIVVTDENFDGLYNDQNKLVVSAVVTQKCKYCTEIIPFLSQVAGKTEDFPNAVFLLIDGDAAPEAARKMKVSTVPLFTFSLKGEVLETFSGSNTEKFTGLLKNSYHKRNEKMKEEDAAVAAAAAEAAEAAKADEEAAGEEEEG
eukprot:TRINITY_DN22875_c0_g1_i2.p1 TRINITY_DN22875_c0_g1~~TRINITY_DN22875_c0_g1_i2.p1  ORF type:complete len:176 (+),score=58.64 TRINITY_DN22875_c0_g1_i2:45-530(+)